MIGLECLGLLTGAIVRVFPFVKRMRRGEAVIWIIWLLAGNTHSLGFEFTGPVAINVKHNLAHRGRRERRLVTSTPA